VLVYADDARVLLLRRVQPFSFWQSVTGSLDEGESTADAARRELEEETGLVDAGRLSDAGVARVFTIDPRWRHRFAPGITENREHEWRYRLARPLEITLDPEEHDDYEWVDLDEAIRRVWSWTNRAALEALAAELRRRDKPV